VTKPGERASTLSQVFLGVRIACAECHHHPYDRWAQTDYYGMTGFFAGVNVKGAPGGEVVAAEGNAVSKNPRTGEDVPAHALGEKRPAVVPSGDHRKELADWLTQPENPYFARNVANRLWAHFLGRGLVEPVDDVRATNPPTNPELLEALAKHLMQNKYDVKALIRAITASRTYQRSSQPNATNERDEQNYSRALFRRPAAEVLLDMVCQTTGVKERFAGMPADTRAVQLWDSKVEHYFLKVFGRPERVSACECERNGEPSVAQVLHLLNSPQVHDKIAHEAGYVAKLVKREVKDEAVVEELYLTFYSRPPSEKERGVALAYLRDHKEKRRQAVEDLAAEYAGVCFQPLTGRHDGRPRPAVQDAAASILRRVHSAVFHGMGRAVRFRQRQVSSRRNVHRPAPRRTPVDRSGGTIASEARNRCVAARRGVELDCVGTC
jgi:hypothetical protein